MIKYLFPERIIKSERVTGVNNLTVKKPLQIGLKEKRLAVFKKGSFVILDFGKELKGSLRLLTLKNNGAKVRVRYGESVTETMSDIGEKNATNDHSVRDFYIDPPTYSDQTYISSGFRFIRIDVYEGELLVKSAVATSENFDKKPIYVYNGKDEEIKKIFDTAKRTVELCACSDYVWDGVKRDRLVWYGDLHPETLSLTTVFGKTKQVENSISLARKEYKLPDWLNGFPSYSMWWIIVVCDYYFMTGCKKFTEKQLDYMSGLIVEMDKYVKETGEINYPFYFTDWATFETPAAVEGVRAINVIAVKKAIELFKEFNSDVSVAENLLKKLNKKEVETFGKKQIIALKCLAKGKTEREDFNGLTKGGAEGFSAFMSYYILKAIAMYDKDKAVALMKEYFGKMIELGATTFWEDFDITWAKNAFRIDELPVSGKDDIHGDFGAYCYKGFRHSLCHGWSSGVIKFIKEYCD